MRNPIIKSVLAVALAASLSSCGDKFLETDMSNGIDYEEALTTTSKIGTALNGAYFQLEYYYFAGDYATMIGDIASDIVYKSGSSNHMNSFNWFTYVPTDVYLLDIWQQGYAIVDNATRITNAIQKLLPETEDQYDQVYLTVYEAEARCLRAYANLAMVNIFCHQAMVDGTSYLDMPGLVIKTTPIEDTHEIPQVERVTIGETYDYIIEDLEAAIDLFEIYGDQGELYYFTEAAAYGLLARANMYLENWDEAVEAADMALQLSGISTLTYDADDYFRLYSGHLSNNESLFALAIDDVTNWSANSCGTLFSNYGWSYSPYLWSLYNGEEDCRTSIMYWWYQGVEQFYEWDAPNLCYNRSNPNFGGGKFNYGGGNNALATNYLINAPEMYLIMAEGYLNQGNIPEAQESLLTVAMRDNAITSTSDLPSSADELKQFLKDERARELFQEGFRLWDLRRWNETANLYAIGAPEINWAINGAKCGDIIFPIPLDEVNAGFGVTQNEGWQNTRPSVGQ